MSLQAYHCTGTSAGDREQVRNLVFMRDGNQYLTFIPHAVFLNNSSRISFLQETSCWSALSEEPVFLASFLLCLK